MSEWNTLAFLPEWLVKKNKKWHNNKNRKLPYSIGNLIQMLQSRVEILVKEKHSSLFPRMEVKEKMHNIKTLKVPQLYV